MLRRSRVALAAAVLAVAFGACSRDRTREVEQAVRTYLDRLIEAYQTGNAALVDPLVSDEQGMKVTGLIGVKLDSGLLMQSKLLELTFVRVEARGDRWIAETREKWSYRDVSMKTGKQVGEASTDSYALRYTFSRKDGKFLLQNLEFTETPVVGRRVEPVRIDPRTAHGLPPPGEDRLATPDATAGTAARSPSGAPTGVPPPGHPAIPSGPAGVPPPGHPPVPGDAR